MTTTPLEDIHDPVADFRPLARLALSDAEDHWVEPLARLYEAASRGIGHLPARELLDGCPLECLPTHLIAIEAGQALLPRTAAAWRVVRSHVAQAHAQTVLAVDDDAVCAALDRILPPRRETDADARIIFDNTQQRLAAAALVDARVGVLTGGPGTGKTTSAATLLALRAALDDDLQSADIRVCAPTGKAANRLRGALAQAAGRLQLTHRERHLLLELRPLTIHRLLGWQPVPPEDGGPWRHHADHPLSTRLVLLDEGSMADVELMSALVQALPDTAALLILGDRDQLDSVEAGGVLAELVARGSAGTMPQERRERLRIRIGAARDDENTLLPTVAPAERIVSGALAGRGACRSPNAWQNADLDAASPAGGPLPGLTFSLTYSYRAKDAPWILELANLIRPGGEVTAARIMACLNAHDDARLQRLDRRGDLETLCVERWRRLAAASEGWRLNHLPGNDHLQHLLATFQLLAGTNRQVAAANARGRRILARDPEAYAADEQILIHGTPLMIEVNAPALDLANGDLGLALGTEPGQPAHIAVFPGLDEVLPLARLPRYRAAFAITIHKSQGSEWQEVAIDLGDHASPLLDRNLFYTAVTRAARRVVLYCSDEALEATVAS